VSSRDWDAASYDRISDAPSMVQHARRALGDRATILCQDLVELTLSEPVEVVFSNATFHHRSCSATCG
jgi:trans-aconitate methyltransferase